MTTQNGSLWTVESQMETTDLGPAGQFVPGIRVTFKTRHGVVSSVFVPRERFTPETVRAAIQAHAEDLDAVQALTGPDK